MVGGCSPSPSRAGHCEGRNERENVPYYVGPPQEAAERLWVALAMQATYEDGCRERRGSVTATEAIGHVDRGAGGAPPTLALDRGDAIDEAGVEELVVGYAQRMVEQQEDEGQGGMRPVPLTVWRGVEGEWLREAAAAARGRGDVGWVQATRRGFRRGVGAERRRLVETFAVSPKGEVHRVGPQQPSGRGGSRTTCS